MEKIKRFLGISAIIVGFLCFAFWGYFAMCFLVALGSEEDSLGSVVETGILFFKNFPVLALISVVLAAIFMPIYDRTNIQAR